MIGDTVIVDSPTHPLNGSVCIVNGVVGIYLVLNPIMTDRYFDVIYRNLEFTAYSGEIIPVEIEDWKKYS